MYRQDLQIKCAEYAIQLADSRNCIISLSLCEEARDFNHNLFATLNLPTPSSKSIYRWVQQYVKNDGCLDQQMNLRKKKLHLVSKEMLDFLIGILDTEPTLYYSELALALWWSKGVALSEDSIRHALSNEGYTTKICERKANERLTYLVEVWISEVLNNVDVIPAASYAFIDEMQLNRDGTLRKKGKARRGRIAEVHAPFHTTGEAAMSAIVTMGIEGILNVTTLEINNSETFLFAFEHHILPTVERIHSHIVLDNAWVHLKTDIISLCAVRNILPLFLPPYSPNLDPVEPVHRLARAYIKKKWGGTSAEYPLHMQISEAFLNCLTPEVACNEFEHCGFIVTPLEREWASQFQ